MQVDRMREDAQLQIFQRVAEREKESTGLGLTRLGANERFTSNQLHKIFISPLIDPT